MLQCPLVVRRSAGWEKHSPRIGLQGYTNVNILTAKYLLACSTTNQTRGHIVDWYGLRSVHCYYWIRQSSLKQLYSKSDLSDCVNNDHTHAKCILQNRFIKNISIFGNGINIQKAYVYAVCKQLNNEYAKIQLSRYEISKQTYSNLRKSCIRCFPDKSSTHTKIKIWKIILTTEFLDFTLKRRSEILIHSVERISGHFPVILETNENYHIIR
jgi:hypothetical protein